MEQAEVHTLIGAYALDALDDAERAEFERHLAECETCRSEVDSLREATAMLAETTLATPPAGLRDRVLADIANVRPLPPVVAPVEPAGEPTSEPTTEQSGSTVVVLAPRRRRRAATFLAAAAAVVAIGAGGVVLTQADDDAPAPDRISAIAEAPDAHTYTQELGDGVTAAVTVSKKRNEAYIRTTGMPSAPSGKEYVLWLQHGTTMVQAGVMPPGPDNTVVLSGDAASANGAAVSVEDAGVEHETPKGDVVAAFAFDA
jgi:hypothetical protein